MFTNETGTQDRAPIDPKTLTAPPLKGVKGVVGQAPALRITNADFMRVVFKHCPEGAVAVVCSKPGDPQSGPWVSEPAGKVDAQCPPDHNNYFNCSTFRPNESAEVRAQKILFGGFHALMLDDVGTKVNPERTAGLKPSWSIETSPGNYQLGYVLAEPLCDVAAVESLQKAIVSAGLCDPGAIGVARWARLPNAVNGKPKYLVDGKAFRCRLAEWNPALCYTVEEIQTALKLSHSPPLPVSSRTNGTNAVKLRSLGDDVYTPASVDNPVLTRLREVGLYKQQLAPGKHDISCPWAHEHTDQIDDGAAYFEPSNAFPTGGFRCHHSHGAERHVGGLIEFLEVSSAEARNRPRIRLVPGELNRVVEAAEESLASQGRFYQAGGAIVCIQADPAVNNARIELVAEQALTRALAEAADWERWDGQSKGWARCDPSVRMVNMLHRAQSYLALPVLRGLARQPFFREEDGKLVKTAGYDRVSGRFAVFDEAKFALGEPTPEAARTSLGRLEKLLEEFWFPSETDRSAALCAMLTAAVRPSLPLAPAFSITASRSGSGKSYLSSIISQFAAPGDPLNVSYPTTSEEATKQVLTLLIQCPAVINFDDMDANWKAYGAINRMLTATTITDRVLGSSKAVTASTQTFVLGSGNNIEPLQDLRRRVISIRLSPPTASPAMLSYKGNPAEWIKREREAYVSDALTIVAAWRRCGMPKADVSNIASFGGPWSDYCRHPLIWLGHPDPATSLFEQVQSDPDSEELGELLEAWFEVFETRATTLRKVLEACGRNGGDRLREAIEDLPVTDGQSVNRGKFGWYLSKQRGRIAGNLQLEKADCGERNAWRVTRVDDEFADPPFTPFVASASTAVPKAAPPANCGTG